MATNRIYLFGNLKGSHILEKTNDKGVSYISFTVYTSYTKHGNEQKHTYHRVLYYGQNAKELVAMMYENCPMCIVGSVHYGSLDQDAYANVFAKGIFIGVEGMTKHIESF